MTGLRRNAETGDHSDRGSPPRMPRWVKITAIIAGVLVAIFVVLQLTGVGGQHGPGRHTLGDTSVRAGVIQPYPAGHEDVA